MLISNTERGLSNEWIQRSNPERSRSKSSLPDPRNKFEASQKSQLSLSGQLYGWDGEGSVSQCQDVTMWLSHVSVTMSPIWSHVTYHGEITQLRASVPSDDERGDWGGDHYILCICTDSAWPGSRSRRMARLGSGGGRAGPGAASLVSVQPASDPETRVTQNTDSDNNRDMAESSHHQ